MKKQIKEAIAKREELATIDDSVDARFQKEFGCKFVMGDVAWSVSNDAYKFAVWFGNRADPIEEVSCQTLPKDRDEAIALIDSREKLHADIVKAREWLIKEFELEDVK